MINYDEFNKQNIKGHNPYWPQIIDNPYRILIIGGSVSGKTKTLLYLTEQQNNNDYNVIDKIYLYVKDQNEALKNWS